MNKDASSLIADLLIQLGRVTLRYSPGSEYRQVVVAKFLSYGHTLATTNANSQKWKDAYSGAEALWKEIVEKLPYVGYSATEGFRKRF